MLIFETGS